MNERIRKLVLKAIYDVDHIYHPVDNPLNEEVSKMYIPDCFAEKFAELIVRECAGIYEKIDNGNLHMGTDDYLEALHKTFFGVEQ
jgi:hypothetical protein